ncbi:bacterio-opsin activator domain-containing protein [Natronosalvus rutilus]|uniref:Helix-turn-helix domain-containing protein n=1 Tax=Natronosalvus rutilus TaxID=2953753 RepID=A0A9E7NAM3_9EURY|nr:bacterio-opsin activator domain-containing protein [Natronosalvus rutilus]UTF54525.1 helix-turn-helix domain-containing protein [Natronosalvus rutilus]
MALFAEFSVPTEAFALHETLEAESNAIVEIERVAATEELITPYFRVSGVDLGAFEAAAADDPSVQGLTRIDRFREATLYRAGLVRDVDAIVYAYTSTDATILEASAQHDRWELRMRFPDGDALSQFSAYCEDRGIPFGLTRLYDRANPQSRAKFGVTAKQHEALLTAWKRGYFSSPEVTLEDVSSEMDITPQALSNRLRRGYEALIEHTVAVTGPDEEMED